MSVVIKITPRGVRSGDPAVLAGLCAQRGAAVLAYCENVAPPGEAGAAAVDAFSRFRGLVAAAPEQGACDLDEGLLAAARRAAAARRSVDVATVADGCPGLHGVLVAWVEDRLPASEHRRIRQHIAECPACADGLRRLEAGERAYGRPPRAPVPERISYEIVDALVAAAPVTALHGDAAAVREHAERRMIMLRALDWPPVGSTVTQNGRVGPYAARAPVPEPPARERVVDTLLAPPRRALHRVRRVRREGPRRPESFRVRREAPRRPVLGGSAALLLGLLGGIGLFVLLDSLSPALPPSSAAGRGSAPAALEASGVLSLAGGPAGTDPARLVVSLPSDGLRPLASGPPAASR